MYLKLIYLKYLKMQYRKLLILSFVSGLGISLICNKVNKKKEKQELKLDDEDINELIKEYVYRFSTR